MNVVRLDTYRTKRLPTVNLRGCRLEKKTIHLLQGDVYALVLLKFGRRGLSSSNPDVVAVLHFWTDLSLVMMMHIRKCLVFSGALRAIDNLSSIFSYESDIHVRLEVWSEIDL